ncbi:unnamed protein product [Cochlearia groenlandica]
MTQEKETMIDSEQKTKQPILVIDPIRSILERLSFVDYHRARSVSSLWYLASTSSFPGTNPTTPWIILFPEEDDVNNHDKYGWCKLYDPISHSYYTLRDLGFNFASSHCLASSAKSSSLDFDFVDFNPDYPMSASNIQILLLSFVNLISQVLDFLSSAIAIIIVYVLRHLRSSISSSD